MGLSEKKLVGDEFEVSLMAALTTMAPMVFKDSPGTTN